MSASKILVLNALAGGGMPDTSLKGLVELATKVDSGEVNQLAVLKDGLRQAGVTFDETEGKIAFRQDDEIVTLLFSQNGQVRGLDIKDAKEVSDRPFVPSDPTPQA